MAGQMRPRKIAFTNQMFAEAFVSSVFLLVIPRVGEITVDTKGNSNPLVFNRETQTFFVSHDKQGRYYELEHAVDLSPPLIIAFREFCKINHPEVNMTSSRIKDIFTALPSELPRIFEEQKGHPSIAFTDKTIRLTDFSFAPHSQANFVTMSFPFASTELDQPTPSFDAFLLQTFNLIDLSNEEQKKTVSTIEEMIGFYLANNTKEPSIFFFFGPGRTGKSTMLNLIRKLFPRDQQTALSIESMSQGGFALQPLIGKRINCPDEDESELANTGLLKALATPGTFFTIQRKFLSSLNIELPAKHLFSCNNLPKFKDVDTGVKRRLHIIPFQNVVPVEHQDKNLDMKLLSEAPGIVGRALRGLKRFMDRNQEWDFPNFINEAKEEFYIDANPALEFLMREYKVISEDSQQNFSLWTSSDDLYKHYQEDVASTGLGQMSKISFNRKLLSALRPPYKAYERQGRKRLFNVERINPPTFPDMKRV